LRWLIQEEKIELSPERRAIKLVNITGDHGIKLKNTGNPLNYPGYWFMKSFHHLDHLDIEVSPNFTSY
jgi:hypothetical protein